MNHAVTIADILYGIGVVVGLALTAIGVLAYFAGGMSDNPEAGADAGKTGCFLMLGGVILTAASLGALL